MIKSNKTERAKEMTITFEINDEEKQLAEEYAQPHAVTIEQAFKEALIEKIRFEKGSHGFTNNNFVGFGGLTFGA